ncbi:response regulator [Aurantivibrio plasticivorans]
MSKEHKILIYQPQGPSKVAEYIAQSFAHASATDQQACLELLCDTEYKVLILDLIANGEFDIDCYEDFLQDEAVKSQPVIVLSPIEELRHKLRAFELGCDDVLHANDSIEEVAARIHKSIFNTIANEQLQSRLMAANETAFTAMADNSDLGSNVQFLVDANNCDNLDELGQLLFSTLSRYELSCSLQMRSLYGIKNMEANGMAKDLESQLLEQMAGAGRYIDFGKRTIMNYGQASILVRNMPLDNQKRYGSIKDNVQALLMGIDARIKALDAQSKLRDEKAALTKLSEDVRRVMTEIDNSYQKVMRDIATVVEDLADAVSERIPNLALSEEQEKFFDEVVTHCVVDTNRIFNEGLRVDDAFYTLCEDMDKALINAAMVEDALSRDPESTDAPPNKRTPGPEQKSIELF